MLERLLAEIDTLDVVAIATRQLVQPFELQGHQLPAGVIVGAATSLVHYREDLYPEPERLRVRPVDDRPVRPAMRAAGIGPGRDVKMVVTERPVDGPGRL